MIFDRCSEQISLTKVLVLIYEDLSSLDGYETGKVFVLLYVIIKISLPKIYEVKNIFVFLVSKTHSFYCNFEICLLSKNKPI